MRAKLRSSLEIPTDRLDAINKILLADNMQVIEDFLAVVDKGYISKQLLHSVGADQEWNQKPK